jgi:hypothetical protein
MAKDQREWTTPEQKAHLLFKQVEYSIARDTKSLSRWFSVKLERYFDLFPTQPVGLKETLQHPEWSLDDKRKFEEKVSGLKINRDYECLPLAC